MGKSPIITAGVIIIGDEILSGRTQETNLAYLGKKLNALGIHIIEARIIPDTQHSIVDSVNHFRTNYDYTFITGGIGPTHDDITSAAVAKAFNVTLEENAITAERLKKANATETTNRARLKMAQIPKGAKLIDNPVSIAPGFQIENVFVMAGVPKIMRCMFDGITDRLLAGAPIRTISISTNIGESTFANALAELQRQYPEIRIGSYPYFRDMKPGVNLLIKGTDQAQLTELQEKLSAMIIELGGQILDQ